MVTGLAGTRQFHETGEEWLPELMQEFMLEYSVGAQVRGKRWAKIVTRRVLDPRQTTEYKRSILSKQDELTVLVGFKADQLAMSCA